MGHEKCIFRLGYESRKVFIRARRAQSLNIREGEKRESKRGGENRTKKKEGGNRVAWIRRRINRLNQAPRMDGRIFGSDFSKILNRGQEGTNSSKFGPKTWGGGRNLKDSSSTVEAAADLEELKEGISVVEGGNARLVKTGLLLVVRCSE